MILLNIIGANQDFLEILQNYQITIMIIVNDKIAKEMDLFQAIQNKNLNIMLHKKDSIRIQFLNEELKLKYLLLNMNNISKDLQIQSLIDIWVSVQINKFLKNEFLLNIQLENIKSDEPEDEITYQRLQNKLKKTKSPCKLQDEFYVEQQMMANVQDKLQNKKSLVQNIKTFEILNQKLEHDLQQISQKINQIPKYLINQNSNFQFPVFDCESQQGFKANYYIDKFIQQLQQKNLQTERSLEKHERNQLKNNRMSQYELDQEFLKQSQNIKQRSPFKLDMQQNEEYSRVYNKSPSKKSPIKKQRQNLFKN